MTIQLEALIERWDSERLLFIRTLPGFVVSGEDAAELAEKTPTALRQHIAWLVKHDLIEEPEGEIDLKLVEDVTARDGAGPRFDADLAVPEEAEIETALAIGRAALSDLIDAYDANDRPTAAHEQTIRHLAKLDRWYGSRLGFVEVSTNPPDPLGDLIAAAGSYEDAVDYHLQQSEASLFAIDGEEWTLAKSLRRRTAHLREHLVDLLPVESPE